MAISDVEGSWHGVAQMFKENEDDDEEYVIVEIHDADEDVFAIVVGGKSIWLSKREFREAFADVLGFKKKQGV